MTNPQSPISEIDILRSLKGLDTETHFVQKLPELLAKESKASPEEIQARSDLLSLHVPELNVDPNSVPSATRLGLLNQQDWEDVSHHESPIMLLWSRARLQEVRAKEQETEERALRLRHNIPSISGNERIQIVDQAIIESSPLVHGTSYDSLLSAIERGVMISNRELDKGTDESMTRGSTLLIDRDLGLDQYVFADFGRPHMHRIGNQPEVTVIIGSEAMLAPGTFITEKDIADCEDTVEYMSRMSLPEDIHETALRRVRNAISGDPDSNGEMDFSRHLTVQNWALGSDADPAFPVGPTFSTWEVKLPEVPIQFVRKLIFRNKQQHQDFVARFGDTIPAVFEPCLRRENLGLLQDKDRYEERYKALVDEDYQKRVKQLEQVGDVEEAYVILGGLRNIEQTDKDLLLKSRPRWYTYMGQQSIYDTREDLEKAIILQRGADQYKAQFSRSRLDPVAVAKIRRSKTAGVSVIEELCWIEQPFGTADEISASISNLS